MIPWKFFDLTARDQTGVLLMSIHRQNTKTQNSADITQKLFDVPGDNALLITSFSIEGDGTVAAFPQTGALQIRDAQSNVVSEMVASFPLVGIAGGGFSRLLGVVLTGSPLIVVGPGMQVWTRVRFDIAAANNHLQGSMNAVLVPRGTMAYQN